MKEVRNINRKEKKEGKRLNVVTQFFCSLNEIRSILKLHTHTHTQANSKESIPYVQL